MSDEQVQNPQEEQAKPEAKVVVARAKRGLTAVSPVKGSKAYMTTEKHTYPFDILVKGEYINGQWSREDGYVEFLVPDDLVEAFEKHHHFQVGNIVAAE